MTKEEFRERLVPYLNARYTSIRAQLGKFSDEDREATMAAWFELLEPFNLVALFTAIDQMFAELKRPYLDDVPGRLAELARKSAQEEHHFHLPGTREGCKHCRGTKWVYVLPYDRRSRELAAYEPWPQTGLCGIVCKCAAGLRLRARVYDPFQDGACIHPTDLERIAPDDPRRDQECIAQYEAKRPGRLPRPVAVGGTAEAALDWDEDDSLPF